MKTNSSTLADSPNTEPQAEAAHTPGPWIPEPISGTADIRIFDGDEQSPTYIATVHRRVYPNGRPYHASDVETEANARLIAAAPALLDVLKITREEMREVAASFSAISQDKAMERAWASVRVLDAAIAQAEGRT